MIYDYRKYVDKGFVLFILFYFQLKPSVLFRRNLYLGINYMVTNQNQALTKDCFDMTKFPLDSIICPTCTFCGSPSYKFYRATNEVTSDYYSFDLINIINSNETQVIESLTIGIYKAWIDEYKGLD
jgi:hypothetical protein